MHTCRRDTQRGRSNLRKAQPSRSAPVRITGTAAVLITVVIAGASFALSFASLYDLAGRSLWPDRIAWLWPVIVDGTIVLATMAIVALAAYPAHRGDRRFFWAVLSSAALISVSGNAVHAVPDPTARLGPWLSAGIACVPPVALLASTHSLAILWRFRPYQPVDAVSTLHDNALAVAASRVEKWDAVAAAIHERGLLPSQPSVKISEVLRFAFDHQPPMSQRAIGLAVDLHHDTVGCIKEAAIAVLDGDRGGDALTAHRGLDTSGG